MNRFFMFLKPHHFIVLAFTAIFLFHGSSVYALDTDADGVDDSVDNCLGVYNPLPQTDSDLDGYGNTCDCDAGNDGQCNVLDAWFFAWCQTFAKNPDHDKHVVCAKYVDMNADGLLNDWNGFRKMFPGWPWAVKFNPGTVPGPSAFSCAGTIPCGGLDNSYDITPEAASAGYYRFNKVEIPFGSMNVAGGNVTVTTPGLTMDSMFGPLSVEAVYNTADQTWRWSWDINYKGGVFRDAHGVEYTVPANGQTIPGTKWVVKSATRLMTTGGMVFQFNATTGDPEVAYWLSSQLGAHPNCVLYEVPILAFAQGPDGPTEITQCGITDCAPLYHIEYEEGRVSKVTQWLDPDKWIDDEDMPIPQPAEEDDPFPYIEISYNAAGLIDTVQTSMDIKADPARAGVRYHYDDGGLLYSITNTNDIKTLFTYYPEGQVRHVKTAGEENLSLSFTYEEDSGVYKTKVTERDGTVFVYQYNDNRLLDVKTRETDNRMVYYAWNDATKLLGSHLTVVNGTYEPNSNVQYIYSTVPGLEREVATIIGDLVTYDYEYALNAENRAETGARALSRIKKDGVVITEQNYDAYGRISSQTSYADAGTSTVTYLYDDVSPGGCNFQAENVLDNYAGMTFMRQKFYKKYKAPLANQVAVIEKPHDGTGYDQVIEAVRSPITLEFIDQERLNAVRIPLIEYAPDGTATKSERFYGYISSVLPYNLTKDTGFEEVDVAIPFLPRANAEMNRERAGVDDVDFGFTKNVRRIGLRGSFAGLQAFGTTDYDDLTGTDTGFIEVSYRNESQPDYIQKSSGGDFDFEYDKLGRLVKRREKVNGAWSDTIITRNFEARRSTQTMANGMEVRTTKDDLGRLERAEYLQDGVLEYDLHYSYEADSNRLDVVVDENAGSALLVDYEYDADGRIEKVTYAGGESIEWTYDGQSRLWKETFKEGGVELRTIEYLYDPEGGRLVQINDLGTSVNPLSDLIVRYNYTYDKLRSIDYGNGLTRHFNYVDEYIMDSLNSYTLGVLHSGIRPEATVLAQTSTTLTPEELWEQTVDDYDFIEWMNPPQTADVLAYSFHVTAPYEAMYPPYAENDYLFEPDTPYPDKAYQEEYYAEVQGYFTSRERYYMINDDEDSPRLRGAFVSNYADGYMEQRPNDLYYYEYDAFGNVTQIQREHKMTPYNSDFGVWPEYLNGYVYDHIIMKDPLVDYQYFENGEEFWHKFYYKWTFEDEVPEYQYNPEKNRLLNAYTLDGDVTIEFTGQNIELQLERELVTYGYDEAGFTTQRDDLTLEWTSQGKIKKITDTVSGDMTEFIWNGAGQAVSRKDNGVISHNYLFGARVEHDVTTSAKWLDFGDAKINLVDPGADRYYRHLDFRGNTKYVTDQTQDITTFYRYHAYGIQHIEGDPSVDDVSFAQGVRLGEAMDDLILLGKRVYDPSVGRFLSPDPVFNMVNNYAYTEGNPVNFTDTTGTIPIGIGFGSLNLQMSGLSAKNPAYGGWNSAHGTGGSKGKSFALGAPSVAAALAGAGVAATSGRPAEDGRPGHSMPPESAINVNYSVVGEYSVGDGVKKVFYAGTDGSIKINTIRSEVVFNDNGVGRVEQTVTTEVLSEDEAAQAAKALQAAQEAQTRARIEGELQDSINQGMQDILQDFETELDQSIQDSIKDLEPDFGDPADLLP